MVLSRMAQDKLEGLPLQDGNRNDNLIVAGISRGRLAAMAENELLDLIPALLKIKGIEGDGKKVLCRVIGKTEQYLAQALAGHTFIGGDAWGRIETLYGQDVFEIWRKVKKGKP